MNEIDIAKLGEIEHILLPPDCHFDEERKRFISCDSSRDLVACAGSGKTTCLVAKLLLLEKSFPFSDNKGVCVLTHTNVAIDEITKHIGKSSPMLSHPNVFMGTIQQFVNKFLAIPYHRKQFGGSPLIDDSFYIAEWRKKIIFISRDAKAYCHRNERRFYPNSLRINYHTGELSTSICGKKISASDQIIHSIKSVRKQITDAGYLSFDDAYNYAFEYLSKYPYIATVIREKFKYVFIDEMQDTSIHQSEILDAIFDPNKTIIQKIGDNNQAIYEDKNIAMGSWIPRDRFPLTKSLRFSNLIADVISDVRIDKTDELMGNENIAQVPPQIILYKNSTIQNVLPKFIEIINTYKEELSFSSKDKIKIVGWKGKANSNDNLQKYYPGYSKVSPSYTYAFSNSSCYLDFYRRNKLSVKTLKHHRDLILQIFVRFLFIQNIKIDDKDVSKSKLISILNTDSGFQEKLLRMSVSLSNNLNIKEDLRSILSTDIFTVLGISQILNDQGRQFIYSEDITELDSILPSQDSNSNIYYTVNEIPVVVSNVHKVKGETHKATMYVETKFRFHDLEKVIPILSGTQTKKKYSAADEYRMKVVYVGISRASILLCLALRQIAVSKEQQQALKMKGWEIHLI